MDEIKHTPGPWFMDQYGHVYAMVQTIDHTRKESIVIVDGRHSEATTEDKALIAQAPELLADRDRLRQINAELVAALELIANSACDHGPGFCARDSARASLAKAKE